MNLHGLSTLLMNLGSPHQFLVQNISPHVYHYTDLNALRGIVIDHDLWLTNSEFSNDSEEGLHGGRVVESVLSALAASPASGDLMRRFAKRIQERLAASERQGVYVCCFCLQDDLLGQWRSYGANGTGVSLEFATSLFQLVAGADVALDAFGLVYLWRVFYRLEEQEQIVKDCLDRVWKDQSLGDEDKVQLAVDAIRFFLPTFKNQAFEEEQEARLVFLPSSTCRVRLEFRVGRGMLVPYYSLRRIAEGAGHATWRPPLTSVRVGPSPNRAVNRRGVELLLSNGGYDGVPVDVSNTPYRG